MTTVAQLISNELFSAILNQTTVEASVVFARAIFEDNVQPLMTYSLSFDSLELSIDHVKAKRPHKTSHW